ncbi:hypothetical protein EXE10_14645 [Acinetobacter sp. WCHAc060033]|uniref:hypothetical protein n=1 Tax=Acinetobacter sp. WCHAc060033 TaxID=2518624 RepID=UPI001022E070|nr:hypothetical protein [Acinetobacter sp. WCHAc060033]RZG80112.1 hypothetical protein EXE10_14645 [Acinetobacter sp. WCHAc060033]
MTTLNYTVKFHKTVLASFIGLCISQSCFALEAMSDEKLGDTTGEGIALLPQDTYMVFRGVGPNEDKSQLLDRTKDIGYINYVPVGPLSQTAADTNKKNGIDSEDLAVGKADIFLYGLALSKANDADPNDANERVGMIKDASGKPTSINAIRSWGTASNPWILKVANAPDVPTFTPDPVGGKNTDKADVAYLSFEAPAFETGVLDAAGSDAYKLKLGMWADAFVRNPNKAEGDAGQFVYGTNNGLVGNVNGTDADGTRANRIRLQAIWNNFSLNGSKIQLFQTLNGATTSGGMSPFYNNTLGLAGVIRLNSGDGSGIRITGNGGTITENSTTSTWQTIHSGQNSNLGMQTATVGNCGNAGTGVINSGTGCQYIVQKQTRTDTKTLSASNWGVTDAYKNRVLRLSTQETTDTDKLYTPALDTTLGAKAPTFAANEGISIYNLNTNLVLGSLYQPLILGSDGKNFSLEIARIPNKESIYKKIYTNYDNYNTATNGGYFGSTCNVYQCGTSTVAGYQGNNATHSSISIGSVGSSDGGKTLQAYTGADSVGIMFGGFAQTGAQTSAAVTSDIYQYAQRELKDTTWRQQYKCNALWQCSTSITGHLYEWAYNGVIVDPRKKPTDSDTCGYSCTRDSPDGSTNPLYGTVVNRTWSDSNLNGGSWRTGTNTAVDGLINVTGGTAMVLPTTNQAIAPVASLTPLNNLGSAVIDGMLIQHMKITTKGL